MKILIISTEFPPGPGGIGTHAFQIAQGLSLKGHQVHAAVCQDYVTKKEITDFNAGCRFGITILRRGPWKIFRMFILLEVYLKIRPDFVLATGDGAVYAAAVLRSLFSFPCAAVEHGRIPASGLERKIKKTACLKMNHIISVSAYTKKRGEEAGFVSGNSTIIHNGADDEIFKGLPENEWKHFRPEDPQIKILLTVGNVTERKGQETVIRALPKILKEFPKTQYWMIGLPTLKKKLEELAESLGVLKNIRFFGKVSSRELVCRLNAADIFLMTSKHASTGDFEGFGIAAVEAALCGKPSIVSGNSGLAEAIVPGKTGIAVPENSEEKTAEAVKSLLKSESLRSEMGERARIHALADQTWKQCIEKYEKTIFKIIKQK